MSPGFTDHPNVVQALEEEGIVVDNLDDEVEIERRIIHVLTIYPKLSMTMIQVGIGTSIPAHRWRNVLERLLEQGKIVRHNVVAESIRGRMQTYKIFSLSATK